MGPAATGPTGGTPRSSGVLWFSTKNAPRVWPALPTVKISYSVFRGTIRWVASTRIGSGPGSRNDASRARSAGRTPRGPSRVSGKATLRSSASITLGSSSSVRWVCVSPEYQPRSAMSIQRRSRTVSSHRLGADRDLPALGVILLAPLGRHGVAAGGQPDDERVGRERRRASRRSPGCRSPSCGTGRPSLRAMRARGSATSRPRPGSRRGKGSAGPMSASTTSPRSEVGCDVPGVGGSDKNPNTTSPNHRPHDIRSPPTLGRGSPHPPLRCDGSESESSHVTLPKAIDPRVQLRFPREGPLAAGRTGTRARRAGPCPRSDP